MSRKDFAIVRCEKLSRPGNPRWIVVAHDTGEVLDDAQGYGFRSPQKVAACWSWKNVSPQKRQRNAECLSWLKKHKDLISELDWLSLDILKGDYGPEGRLNAKMVQEVVNNPPLNGFAV